MMSKIFKQSLVATLLFALTILSTVSVAESAKLDEVVISAKNGHIQSSYEGSDGRHVYLIQDAHCIYQAQANMIDIIRQIVEQTGAQLIAIEGASGDFNVDELATFPDARIKSVVADNFMKKGLISGAEYLLITGELGVILRGIDNRELYISNFNSLYDSERYRNTAKAFFSNLSGKYEEAGKKLLSEELNAFLAQSIGYQNGTIGVSEYFRYLIDQTVKNSINTSDYTQFSLLKKIFELQDKVDFNQINADRKKLIDVLSSKLTRNDLSELLMKDVQYKINKYDPQEFFSYLLDTASKNEVAIDDFSNLQTYVKYLEANNSLNSRDLVDEVDRLETAIKSSLLRTAEEKEFAKRYDLVMKIEKFIQLKLSSKDYATIVENREISKAQSLNNYIESLRSRVAFSTEPLSGKDAQWLDANFPVIENFFKIARIRDAAMVENSLLEMDMEGADAVILIAGGFHSQGIEETLQQLDVSYTNIVPNITEDIENNPYERLIAGALSPYERTIQNALGFLAYQRILAQTPFDAEDKHKEIFTTQFKIESLLQFSDQNILAEYPELQRQLVENPIIAREAFLKALDQALGDYKSKLQGIEITDLAILKNGERYYKLSINGTSIAFRMSPRAEIIRDITLAREIAEDLVRLSDIVNQNVIEKDKWGLEDVQILRPEGFDAAVVYAVEHKLLGTFDVPTQSKIQAQIEALFNESDVWSTDPALINGLFGVLYHLATLEPYQDTTISMDAFFEYARNLKKSDVQFNEMDKKQLTVLLNSILPAIDQGSFTLHQIEAFDPVRQTPVITYDYNKSTINLTPKLAFMLSLINTAGNIRSLAELPGFSQLIADGTIHPSWSDREVYIEGNIIRSIDGENLSLAGLGVVASLMQVIKNEVDNIDLLQYEVVPITGPEGKYVKIVMKSPVMYPRGIEAMYPGIVTIRERIDESSPIRSINNVSIGRAFIQMDTTTGIFTILAVDHSSQKLAEVMSPSSILAEEFINKSIKKLQGTPDAQRLEALKNEAISNMGAMVKIFALYPELFNEWLDEISNVMRNHKDSVGNPTPFLIEGVVLKTPEGVTSSTPLSLVKRDSLPFRKMLGMESPTARQVFEELADAISKLPLAEGEQITAEKVYQKLIESLEHTNPNCAVSAMLPITRLNVEAINAYLTQNPDIQQIDSHGFLAAIVYALDSYYRNITPSNMVSETGQIHTSLFAVAKGIEIFDTIVRSRSDQPADIPLSPKVYRFDETGFTENLTLIRSNVISMLLKSNDQLILTASSPHGVPHYISVKALDETSVVVVDKLLPEEQKTMEFKEFLRTYETRLGNYIVSMRPEVITNIQASTEQPDARFLQALRPVSNEEMLNITGACGVAAAQGINAVRKMGAILEGRGFDNYGVSIKLAYDMKDLPFTNLDDFRARLASARDQIQRELGRDTDWSVNYVLDPQTSNPFMTIQAASRGIGPATRSEEKINKDLDHKIKVVLSKLLTPVAESTNFDNIGIVADRYDFTLNGVTVKPASEKKLQHTRYKTKGGDRIENAHHEVYNMTDPRLDQPISVSVGFNGDFESYLLFKNILIAKYGETFKATSDTEVLTHLFTKMSITQNADGTYSPVAGEIALTRLFRLVEMLEGMLNISAILKNDHYTDDFKTRLRELLSERFAQPGMLDQLLIDHEGNKAYDKTAYPQLAIDFAYDILERPWILDDGNFGAYSKDGNFFGISGLVRDKMTTKRAAASAMNKYFSVTDEIGDFMLWLAGKSIPKELANKSPEDQRLALEEAKQTALKAARFAGSNLILFAESLKGKSDEHVAQAIQEIKRLASDEDSAYNYVTITGKVSSITLNLATGQDLHRLLVGRFGPKSTNFYLGIGEGAVYMSSEPRAFGPIIGEVKDSEIAIEDVLAVASGTFDMIAGSDYTVMYLDQDVTGKTKAETAKSVKKIDIITGKLSQPEARTTQAKWNDVLNETEYAKLSAFEVEASVQGATMGWTLDKLTKFEDGKWRVNFGEDYTLPADIAATAYTVGSGSGTSMNALMLAMEEARRNNLKLLDFAGDADILKASDPALLKGNAILLAVTQSGETGVAIQNLRRAKNDGSFVFTLTNRRGSTCYIIGKESGGVIVTESVDESAVAATGSNTNQIYALRLLALKLSQQAGLITEDDVDFEIRRMKDNVETMKVFIEEIRMDDSDLAKASAKAVEYMHKYGLELGTNEQGDFYAGLDGANIYIGGIGVGMRIADEFETKLTEMTRRIIGKRQVETLIENNITEQPQYQLEAETRRDTLQAMLDKYAPVDTIKIDDTEINLDRSTYGSYDRYVVLGNAAHTHTLQHVENTYFPRFNKPLASRMYAEDSSDIQAGALVMAISPQTDVEIKSLVDMLGRGAKVIVIGTAEQLQLSRDTLGVSPQVGYFETVGPHAVTANWLGIDLLLKNIATTLKVRDFQTPDSARNAIELLRAQLDGLSRLAEQFATQGSNNRINIDRLISEIRKDKRGWRKVSTMAVGKVNELSYAADFSSKYTRSNGNAVIFKELATMKHGYYAPLGPGSFVFMWMPKKGYPGYDNVVKGIAEMVPRVNYPYDNFIKNPANPIGILVAITPEDDQNYLIRLLSDEEYASLEQNVRLGNEDETQRPNIVFTTPTGGELEHYLLNDLISNELYKAYESDRIAGLNEADLARGNLYINIEFPEADQEKMAEERRKIIEFKKNFPNSFILTVAPAEGVDGVEEYSDAVVRLPRADSTLALAVCHFLSLNLTRERFKFPLTELQRLAEFFEKNHDLLAQYSADEFIIEYAKGKPNAVAIMDAMIKRDPAEYGNPEHWRYIPELINYIFREGNLDPILSLGAAKENWLQAFIVNMDLIKNLAKVVTNDSMKLRNYLPGMEVATVISPWNHKDLFESHQIATDITKQISAQIQVISVEDQAAPLAFMIEKSPAFAEMIDIMNDLLGAEQTRRLIDSHMRNIDPANIRPTIANITQAFIESIVIPRFRRAKDILGNHYANIDDFNFTLSIAGEKIGQRHRSDDGSTIVIEASAFLSDALLVSTIEHEMSHHMFESDYRNVLIEQFKLAGEINPEARADAMLTDFTELMIVDREINRLETSNINLFDRALTVITTSANRIDYEERFADMIRDIRQRTAEVYANTTLTPQQKAAQIIQVRIDRIREYVSLKHDSTVINQVTKNFLADAYLKAIAAMEASPQKLTGEFMLGLDPNGSIIDIGFTKQTQADIAQQAQKAFEREGVPAVHMISFDLIASNDKSDLLTDTNTLDIKRRITQLRGEGDQRAKNRVVIFSWERSGQEIAQQLTHLGITVEKGLQNNPSADVIVIGREDVETFSGEAFVDPKTASSQDAAKNMPQVVDLIRNIILRDLTGLTNADFTLLAHNPDVIDSALDFGLKVGVSTYDSAKTQITETDMEQEAYIEIGGDRIRFLELMGPNTIIPADVTIRSVSEVVRPELFAWFLRTNLLKQLDFYEAQLDAVAQMDITDAQSTAITSLLVSLSSLKKQAEETDLTNVAKMKEINQNAVLLFASIDSNLLSIVGAETLQKIKAAIQSPVVTVQDMQEHLGVDFVLGGEMAGIGIKLPERKIDKDLGNRLNQQLQMHRKFEISA